MPPRAFGATFGFGLGFFYSGGKADWQALYCIATSVLSVPLFVVCGLAVVVGWMHFVVQVNSFLINPGHFVQHCL